MTVVVQVEGDAVVILQPGDPELAVAGVGQGERDRGVGAKGRGHPQIGRSEPLPTGEPAQGQRTVGSFAGGQRDEHHRPDPAHRERVGLGTVVGDQHGFAGAHDAAGRRFVQIGGPAQDL
ncbi:MAG TPA: hypothetical protein VIJ23_00605 [Mycobacterium sp.]